MPKSHNYLGDLRLSDSSCLHISFRFDHLRIATVARLQEQHGSGPCSHSPLESWRAVQVLKKILSLGEYILCTLQLHPSSLKTFQATYLNSSHMVMPCWPRSLLLLVCSLLSANPWAAAAAKQPVNVRSFMCFQNQAWCFQHPLSFSCAQTTV